MTQACSETVFRVEPIRGTIVAPRCVSAEERSIFFRRGHLTSRSTRVEVLNPLAIKKLIGTPRRRGSSPPLLCDPGWVV